MLKKLSLLSLVLFAVFTLVTVTAQPAYFRPGEALPDGPYAVSRVVDGDTFAVQQQVATPDSGGVMAFVERRVRVLGIDTPERGRPFYAEANAEAAQILEADAKLVFLAQASPLPIDRFGRALATVTLGNSGRDYALLMVSAGLSELRPEAKDLPNGALLVAANKGARSVGKGLYAGLTFKDYNCTAFDSRAEAQAFYEAARLPGRPDPSKLDPDKDGLACESLKR